MDPEIEKLFENITAQSQRMSETLAAITATGSDDDELVTATCGPGNKLVDIEFDPRSRRLDTHDLKEKVLTAVARAAEATEKQLMRALEEQTAAFTGMQVPGIGELQKTMQETQAKLKEQQAHMEDLARRAQGR